MSKQPFGVTCVPEHSLDISQNKTLIRCQSTHSVKPDWTKASVELYLDNSFPLILSSFLFIYLFGIFFFSCPFSILSSPLFFHLCPYIFSQTFFHVQFIWPRLPTASLDSASQIVISFISTFCSFWTIYLYARKINTTFIELNSEWEWEKGKE